MRRESSSCALMFMLVLALALVVVLFEVRIEHAQLSPGQCKEERRLIVNACRAVLFGQSASAACCQRVRVTRFECVCPVIDPKLVALITVNRATKLLQDCRRTVPRLVTSSVEV